MEVMTNPVDTTTAYYLTKERRKEEGLDHRRSIQKDDYQPEKEKQQECEQIMCSVRDRYNYKLNMKLMQKWYIKKICKSISVSKKL